MLVFTTQSRFLKFIGQQMRESVYKTFGASQIYSTMFPQTIIESKLILSQMNHHICSESTSYIESKANNLERELHVS